MRVLNVSWRFVVGTLISLALGVAMFAFLAPEQPFLLHGQAQNAGYSNYYPGGASCDPARLRSSKQRQTDIERDRCKDAAEEHRLKSEDLVQQTRSAEANEAITELTYKQSLLMAGGTAIGFLTLVAAMFAVLYARDAARAAEGQLKHLARVNEAELRPYLFVDRVALEASRGDGAYRIVVFLKNYGKIPARSNTAQVHAYPSENLHRLSGYYRVTNSVDAGVCAPGHERKVFDHIHLLPSRLEAIRHGPEHLIVRIRYRYHSERGDGWNEAFDYFTYGDHFDKSAFFILGAGTRRKSREYAQHQREMDLTHPAPPKKEGDG
jgi:hypothetical protein